MMTEQHAVKTTMDTISVVTVIGTLMDILPPVAALLTIVWTCINIYESVTFQKFVARFKKAKDKA
jgi:hypothetical protein